MEEDIKILENMLNKESSIHKRNKRGNKEIKFEVNSNYYKAIEYLLKRYKELIIEKAEALQEMRKYKAKANDSIPTSVIQEKIKSLEEQRQNFMKEYVYYDVESNNEYFDELAYYDHQIDVLQEILEEGRK